ncbi:MAG: histone deacetylase [Phototrophicaceae bacterium]|jgi:acetoin utilization deacetylase AcuC-like enzyme
MTTAFLTDTRFLEHDEPGHPEFSGRLKSVWQKLDAAALRPRMLELAPKAASEHTILLAHTRQLLNRLGEIEAMNNGNYNVRVDADTYMSPKSYTIARIAAGAICDAVDAVLDGEADNALCAVRPPGHHATPDRAMGFCLLNNIAIGARHAQSVHNLKRVMIVDYDVHHGNGTQDIFYSDPSVLFVSTHQYPLYPGTGWLEETGEGAGEGYTLNIPMPAKCGDANYAAVFEQVIWPAAQRYQPELIMVSAGFDAHWGDPLAGMNLTLAGYTHLTRELIRMAQTLCEGKIVFVMEGGYNLEAIGAGVANIAHCLLGDDAIIDPLGAAPKTEEPNIAPLIETLRQLHGLA